ncbi:MAG: metal-dependent hydrolase [Vulcanimicrobiaceae bacterium]
MTTAGHIACATSVATIVVCSDPTLMGLLLGAGVLVGGNAPDLLELHLPGSTAAMPVSLIPHRTIMHYPWFYVALLFGAHFLLTPPWSWFLGGCALGALLHLLIDSVSPHGIPLFSPLSSVKPPVILYKTRSASEWVVIGPFVLVATVVAWLHSTAVVGAFHSALAIFFSFRIRF